MEALLNIDLLTVGMAIAANLLIGFAAFFSNKKSATNILFLLQTLVLSLWSVANYISYQSHTPTTAIILVRIVFCLAVAVSIIFLIFMNTFPSDKVRMKRVTLVFLVVIAFIVMGITMTPLLVNDIVINTTGAPTPIMGPGIIPFLITAIFSLPLGMFYILRNYLSAPKDQKKQFLFLIFGVVIMFTSIIGLVFLLPSFFHNTRFVPLSAALTFPFVFFTGYSIYRYKLFNIKDVATVFIALALTVVTFIEVINSQGLSQILFRVSIFTIVLIFSIRLIRDMFALEFANERLKELDKMKSEFVSLATHQIRAPLTSIKGYISLIQEGDYGPVTKEVTGALDIIMQSAVNLVTIVNDFLDVSRIELGRMKYDYTDFDVQELVQQVVTEYKPNVQRKGLIMDYNFDASKQYKVHADRGKIKQVIGNILDNSIKYTLQGFVKVELGFSPVTPNNIRVKIFDSGVGIPTATLPKLFQKFTRAENANDANILGTGLGLYVAKQMIDAHNGKVWAESEGQGKGAQFYIELPVT